MSEGTNLGAGNEESDPAATEESSSNQAGAGGAKRNPEGAPDTEAEAGVGGLDT
jgi:hypothetical protein